MLAVVLGIAIVVAACGGGDSDAASQPTAAQTTDAQADTSAAVDVGSRVGQQGPDLMLTSVDGEQITLSDLRGSPVILYYFATW